MASKITGERVPTPNPDNGVSADRASSDAASVVADERAVSAAVTVDAPDPLAVTPSGEGQASTDRWTGIATGDSGHRSDLGSGSREVPQSVREHSTNFGSGLLALHQAAIELAASRA